MPQLQSLDLGANQISHPQMGTMSRLRWLSLRNNGIERLSETFVTAPELGFLFLQENKMTALPNVLGSMTRLSLLDAGANPLTALPDNIGNLKQLQSLRLERCALTDLPTAIAGLDSTNGGSLRELRLAGNPIPSDKRSQIQALVPKARIFW
jgi:Leucine-rich repeat (LRR) protein